MSESDDAYDAPVPPGVRELADERGLGDCNWFIKGADAAPYYPESVRTIFEKVANLSTGSGGSSARAVDGSHLT
jgi:hypothetical protein